MKLAYTPIISLIALLGDTDAAVERPSCTNYTKGQFEPKTITDQKTCETACQIAEGLSYGRFNTEEGSDYVLCYCINEDQQGKTTELRDLCTDGTKSSGGTPAIIRLASVSLAATIISMMTM